MARNPLKDTVAVVGVGSTGFSRASGRSSASMACEAAIAAIRDAGLGAADIDGVVSTGEIGAPKPHELAAMLGLRDLTHYVTTAQSMFTFGFIDAVNAVHAGSADTVLVYNPVLRLGWNSRSAAADPFRAGFTSGVAPSPDSMRFAVAYTAWASRYMYEHGVTKEAFGRVSRNARACAVDNPLAVLRTPITMADYHDARMIREPLSMFDMDIPADGADAFVITTAERARDLSHRPVLVHATSSGAANCNWEDQLGSLDHHGQHVVVDDLRAKSDLWIDDVDLYLPYDGFTMITLQWIEAAGWCGKGEAGDFLADNTVDEHGRVMIRGRVPMNPHGGQLAEAATRGAGIMREAVHQLRGDAGPRQAPGASSALLTPGGFFFNPQGVVLRAD